MLPFAVLSKPFYLSVSAHPLAQLLFSSGWVTLRIPACVFPFPPRERDILPLPPVHEPLLLVALMQRRVDEDENEVNINFTEIRVLSDMFLLPCFCYWFLIVSAVMFSWIVTQVKSGTLIYM